MNFFVISLIKAAVVAFVLMTTLAYLQWIERKVIAHIQLRVGPRRVGPHGLLQPLADVIKLLTKEDMLPSHVNKVFYFLAPFIAVFFALIAISVIPFGTDSITIGPVKTAMQLTDLNIGVLFILGLSGMGVYGVALAGWASNNKYALLGGLRSSAQMISYELPMAMAIAAPLLMLNTLSFRQLVDAQGGFYFGFIPRWTIFQGPFPQIVSFLLFMVAAFAETNRVPFDLPEAENELVAGFHTEYSSMKFAAFFMAEYANMVTVSCVATLLFLGGWQPLFPAEYGSRFIPSIIFLLGGAAVLLSRPQSRAAVRPHHASRRGRGFPGRRRGVSDPDGGDDPASAVLVRFESRRDSVPLYMGTRHAPALPLRSVDALRLDLHVSRSPWRICSSPACWWRSQITLWTRSSS